MKRYYTKPTVEKVEFNYREQVVAASGGCVYEWSNITDSASVTCHENRVPNNNVN